MNRDSFLFYKTYIDAAHALPEEKRLWFYETIFEFAMTGIEPQSSGDPVIDMAFMFITPLVKANIRNFENGIKGGAPRGNQNARKTTQKQPKNNRQTTQKQGNVSADVSHDLNETVSADENVDIRSACVSANADAAETEEGEIWEPEGGWDE